MRKLSIKSIRNFREHNRNSSVREMSFRGEPIFTRNGEPLYNVDIYMMTDEEVISCIEAEYQEQPNPLGVVAKSMDQKVCDAIDCLKKSGIKVRITSVELR